jgi:hypothetical protein
MPLNLGSQRGFGAITAIGCLGSLTWAMTAHISSQFAGGSSTWQAGTTAACADERDPKKLIAMMLTSTRMSFFTETSLHARAPAKGIPSD